MLTGAEGLRMTIVRPIPTGILSASKNGKLSALRWVLGDDWDMLDT